MLQNKLPKGYYIVCMIFILTVLINFSYVFISKNEREL